MKLSLPSVFLAATAMVMASLAIVGGQAPPQNGVVRLDHALDALIPTSAKAELLKGDYFGAIEGPVWVDEGQSGYLLFSDMAANVVYKWTPARSPSLFLDKSRFTGTHVNSVWGQYPKCRPHGLLIRPT